ncbi:hypothetical protein ONV78_16855 [Hahella sp. CR1]|uniref:hypothetical protein n=1 Tax=Hahella sp. CR1 TaxID=2992807 RepID=UPI0024416680|nr:hypothetical protein [Hahella sp. CR1]MDG9669411.1 hypothetical protein [Hahella sp. CR1]
MKAIGIISILLALLYVAYLSVEHSEEAERQKEKAEQQIDQAQKQIEAAMEKNRERLEQGAQ